MGLLQNISFIPNKSVPNKTIVDNKKSMIAEDRLFEETIPNEEIKRREKEKIDLRSKLVLIEKMNRIKKKAIKRVFISTEKFWALTVCKIFSCCIDKQKRQVVNKSIKVVKQNMEISEVIKNNLEFKFLMKFLLEKDEQNLVAYKFKYLNLGNIKETKNYLDELIYSGFKQKVKKDDPNIEKEYRRKIKPTPNVCNLMQDYKDYYNY